jgi:predicted nucleotidyltransferase
MNIQRQVDSFGWKDCPESVRRLVDGILTFYRQVLGKNLTGFYLHGSLAMGCFNPGSSDIDFLAVVRRKLTVAEKKNIIDYLLSIDNGSSTPAPEMSIVTEDCLDNLTCPCPFELHYSYSWRERYLSGKVDWEEPRCDADLVMHYLAIKHRGICLYGRPIKAVFPGIPRDMCIASLNHDLNWISERMESLPATYIVLNPCRALALLNTDTFMSKKEGGEWALSGLPREFSPLINQALTAYSSAGEAARPGEKILKKFVAYSRKELGRWSAKQDNKNTCLKRRRYGRKKICQVYHHGGQGIADATASPGLEKNGGAEKSR